jgi:hypothetical protein
MRRLAPFLVHEPETVNDAPLRRVDCDLGASSRVDMSTLDRESCRIGSAPTHVRKTGALVSTARQIPPRGIELAIVCRPRENPASSPHPTLASEIPTEGIGGCTEEPGATPVSRSAPAA